MRLLRALLAPASGCPGVTGIRRPIAFLALMVLLPALALSQEGTEPVAEISLAEGTSEVLLPDTGWRRAVLGRRLPADSIVASWLDSRVVIARGESSATLGAVSHVAVLGIEEERLVLRLDAGRLDVSAAEGIIIELPVREARIVAEEGTEFSSTTRTVSVLSGALTVEVQEIGILTVAPGESVSLVPHDFEPIFTLKPR